MTEKKTCDNCRLKAFCFTHAMTPVRWAKQADEPCGPSHRDCILWARKQQKEEKP